MIPTAMRTKNLRKSRDFSCSLLAVNPNGGGALRGAVSNRGSAP